MIKDKITYNQAKELSFSILNSLDSKAIDELMGGDENDIGKIVETLHSSCYEIIESSKPKLIESSNFEHLDSFTNSVDSTLKALDISYFTASFFPEFQFDWHIFEWSHFIQTYDNLCVIAPRGRGKSFYFAVTYGIWKVFGYEKNPIPSQNFRKFGREGVILSASMEQAKKRLSEIKQAIESNAELSEKLKPKTVAGWAKESLILRNGTQLYIKGFDTELRGFHPTFSISDDILSENQLVSKMAREKAIDKFIGSFLKLVIEGQNIVVGTPFHDDDLYGYLKKNPYWQVFIYPAIYPNGEILAPSRFDYEYIKKERSQMGKVFFSREILCKPVSGASSIFPYDTVSMAYWGMENEKLVTNRESVKHKDFIKIVMGCDFAISATVGSDYSVFITLGVEQQSEHSKPVFWLLNVFRVTGMEYSQQIAKIKELYMNFRHDVIYCEANQMQVIFPQQLEKDGLPVKAHHTGANKIDMKKGLPSLAVLFEQRQIKFPRGDEHSRNITDLITSELGNISFTDKGLEGVGSHDDTVMALWIATLAARSGGFDFDFL